MTGKGKLAIFLICDALCALIALSVAFFTGSWGALVKCAFFASSAVGLVASFVTFLLDKEALLKSAFILLILAATVLASFIAVGEIGRFNDYETDADKIEALVRIIENTGGWGMTVFVLLQILQVVILPLPAAVCYIPGALVWGPLTATLLASLGVLVGSLIAYFIGKIWGKKAVIWIAGRETTLKYSAYFGKKGKTIFVLMQILPFFPDDILCMVAGLTGMNFVFFTATMVLVRPLIIAAYCFLGSGTVIPFSGWGIGVWIGIFAACVLLAVLSWKYQERFEKWLVSKFKKRKNDE